MTMRDVMRALDHIAEKVPLATKGQALLGLTFVLCGLIIGRAGYLQLAFLWRELAAFLPFTVTPDLQQRIMSSLPLIVTIFVSTVSSIAALLIGVLWFFSGLAQAYRAGRRSADPPPFQHPDLVAESLRQAEPFNWASAPIVVRLLALVWPGAKSLTPVTYEMFTHLAWTLVKLLLTALAIALATYVLQMIPAIVRNVLRTEIGLFVPSARPLYVLIGLVFVLNVLGGLSLIPLRQPPLERSSAQFPVRGRGDPHILLALVEEGSRLLTQAGHPERNPVRLVAQEDLRMKGSLSESFPTETRSLGRPAAYTCLVLLVFFSVAGFSRLVHFPRAVAPMAASEFLSVHLLAFILDVAFSLGVVLCGLHFAEWAAKLFGMRRFRSSVLFCWIATEPRFIPEPLKTGARSGRTPGSREITWKPADGVDEQFAHWAKQPEAVGRFTMEACWGDVISESASSDSPRHLNSFGRSSSLDDAVKRILQLPFYVGFQREEPQKPPPPPRPSREGRDETTRSSRSHK